MSANSRSGYITINSTWIAVALVAAIGCAPAAYIPLTQQSAATIHSTRLHATIAQEGVTAAVEESNAGGIVGGLLGALISSAVTSHRTDEANKLVEPIRKEVSDFDFRAAYFESLEHTLPTLGKLRTTSLTTSKVAPTDELLAATRAQTKENTFLSLNARYELSADFRTFLISTTVEILRSGDEPLYRSTFVYVSDPVPGEEAEDAALAWASNHGAALRTAMREGIDETMKMVVRELGARAASASTPAVAQISGPVASAGPPAVAPASAQPAEAIPALATSSTQRSREIVRRDDGIMYSIPRDKPVAEGSKR